MSDSPPPQDDKDEKEYDKILRQAWITTSLERDKAIITLSSAGIALLATLLSKSPYCGTLVRFFFLLALIGFTASILAGVWCLHLNRTIFLNELKRLPEPSKAYHDKILEWGFVTGVGSIFVIILITIVSI